MKTLTIISVFALNEVLNEEGCGTMTNRRIILLGAAALFLVSGCAATSDELSALREQVRLQQKQIVDIKSRQDEQQAKLEILDNGFRIIGDKVDENARRLDSGASAAPAMQAPAITAPTQPPPPGRIEPPAPPPAAATPEAPLVVQPRLNAADLYRSALDNFTREEYGRAILEFEEFVANHPEHDLADNAQYWIGECYYAQKEFAHAVQEFDKVEKHFGQGNKVAASLLKKGLALRELDRKDEALQTLEKVISSYPESDEASIAEKKLSLWR